MIRSFSVKNFKNFNDWFEFDLGSSGKYEFNTDCVSSDIVKTALIYGYNGVGKSNLGYAMFDIINHMTDKNVNKALYSNYSNALSSDPLSEFKYVFQFPTGRVVYQYGKTDIDTLKYETVTINEKQVLSYNRDTDSELSVALKGTSGLNRKIADLKISAVKYVKANSVLDDTDENRLFTQFCSFVDNMLIFWALDSRSYLGYEAGNNDILQDIISRGHINEFKHFLHESGVQDNIRSVVENGREKLVYDFNKKTLDFYINTSAGIRSLTLFYYWFQRTQDQKNSPSFIFIDEYDAFYHSRMAEFVVRQLKSLPVQVILTSHNTGLMSNDLMRPDCCFLMYPDKILPLSKRSDKELRYAHNIEKMYRAGVFDE